jgi:hypothetical protein
LTTLRGKPVKIGAGMVRHGGFVTFQLAEVAVSRRRSGMLAERLVGAHQRRNRYRRSEWLR